MHILMRPLVEYYYPMWHKVSFTYIAEYHIRELKRYYRVYAIDELAFFNRDLYTKSIRIVHPYLFIVQRNPKYLLKIAERSRALIAVDVADSDMINQTAVTLLNIAHCCIVPSSFCKEVYERCGVKVPVHVVPHGVSELYFKPRFLPSSPTLIRLLQYKETHNCIYVLYILMHSGWRKGAHLVYEVMKEILRMYPNVKLVIKFGALCGQDYERLSQLTNLYFAEHLSERDMVALYDMCDIYTMFSIGGAFEHCALQALARGLVVLASDKGAWTDYLPDFCLIPHSTPVKVFPDADPITSIHCGYGYPVDVEKAIDKLKDVIENLDDYKARVREYWYKIKHKYTWTYIGMQLKEIIDKYL